MLTRRVVCLIAALCAAPAAHAQDAVSAFYRGKTITFYVASTAGGGYDAYARLLTRHIGRYIPGAPALVVSNMPGAGGHIVAAHVYNIAPKDGTAAAIVLPGTITDPLYNGLDKVKHNPARFAYLGSANREVNMCYARADSGVTSAADLAKRVLVIGGSADGASTRDQPAVQNSLLGHKFRIVAGYPGSREIFLAIEKNEVSGICGLGLPALRQQRADWLDSGFLKILTQDNARGDPKVTAMGVPRTVDLAKSEEDRRVMELIYSQQDFGRPFLMAPETPPERLAALRKAFLQAFTDKELLAEAERLKLDINPLPGEEMQEIVTRLYATPAAMVERAKAALVYKAPE